jgi:hypothetical protein
VGLENLAESRYLVPAYTAASDSWAAFRTTGEPGPLYEVSAILCGLWQTLSEDDEFFAGLEAATVERMPPVFREGLKSPVAVAGPKRSDGDDDFASYLEGDRLLSKELVVLVQAGLDPSHAVRLVTDLSDLLGDRVHPLDKGGVTRIRRSASDVADELCAAQRRLRAFGFDPIAETIAGHQPHSRWPRALRTIGRALGATAGAATVAANVVAAVATHGIVTALGLASVHAGAQAMSQSLELTPRSQKTAGRRVTRPSGT